MVQMKDFVRLTPNEQRRAIVEAERSVDAGFDTVKNDLLQKCRNIKLVFNFQGKGLLEKYEHARILWSQFRKFKNEQQYENAFICLHIFVRLVLEYKLHRAIGPRYEGLAGDVQVLLSRVELEMNSCLQGIRERLKLQALQRISKDIFDSHALNTKDDLLKTLMPPSKSYLSELENLTRIEVKGETALQTPVTKEEIVPRKSLLRSDSGVDYQDDFTIKHVVGDGNCAFRAIAQGLGGGALSIDEEYEKALELRKVACDKIMEMKGVEMTGTGLTVEQVILLKEPNFESVEEYVQSMRKRAYAGETEFWILSGVLGVNIAVYIKENDKFRHLITYGDSDREPVRILFQKGKTETENHYELLLPARKSG